MSKYDVFLGISRGEKIALFTLIINMAKLLISLYVKAFGKLEASEDGNIINVVAGIKIVESIIEQIEKSK